MASRTLTTGLTYAAPRLVGHVVDPVAALEQVGRSNAATVRSLTPARRGTKRAVSFPALEGPCLAIPGVIAALLAWHWQEAKHPGTIGSNMLR